MNEIRNAENMPKNGYKYKFSKKLNCWVRTSPMIAKDDSGLIFLPRVLYSTDRNTPFDKWQSQPPHRG